MSSFAPYAARHKDPQGAGDKRPTALEIVQDCDLVDRLSPTTNGPYVMLITGCTSGIGPETARALHATGADIYITARDAARGEEIAHSIRQNGGKGKVAVLEMELGSLASVRRAADTFLRQSGQRCNVLVANAGVMACPEGRTADGFETQFGVNHLAHFLLFQLLKPALLASATPQFPSRVVVVSSSGHREGPIRFGDHDLKKSGYTPFGAYGQSKLANVYMASEIERRYGRRGLHAFSLMPGGIMTPLQKHLDPKLMDGWKTNEAAMKMSKSAEQGAATSVMAALSTDLLPHAGRYLEDCAVAQAVEQPSGPGKPGYAPYAYDEESEGRLWKVSLEMVGLQQDD